MDNAENKVGFKYDNNNTDENEENIVFLVTAVNDTEEMIFEGILVENDIPYLKKKKETGGIMEIYMGFSLFGSDFFVGESRFEEAASLLEAYASEQPFFEEEQPQTDISDGNNGN